MERKVQVQMELMMEIQTLKVKIQLMGIQTLKMTQLIQTLQMEMQLLMTMLQVQVQEIHLSKIKDVLKIKHPNLDQAKQMKNVPT